MENNLSKFRNKLIVFEGSDGTGKTLVAKEFVTILSSASIQKTMIGVVEND